MNRRPRLPRFLLAAPALVAVLALGACGSSGSKSSTSTPTTVAGQGGAPAVSIVNSGATWKYQPATLTVAAGTAVTWTNTTDVPHSVTFGDASVPSSKLFNKGESFTAVMPRAGTFSYICSIHPTMHGTVVVH
jgi:plastocyanin